MFSVSRRALLLALVATAALLAPAAAATTDSMADATTSSAADQITEPYTSDATASDTAAENESDEPEDSGLECQVDFVGDGQCDDINNSASCSYDGGDCCECTCSPGDFNCGGNYDCVDPDAECVDDDDGDGGVQTTMDLGTDDRLDGTDDEAEADADADADADETGTASDSATESRPRSFLSAGIAAAAGAAVVLAAWGL